MSNVGSEPKRPIESLPPIPWKVDWRTKRFIYIAPQIELLLGWPRESWCTLEDWIARIHPLDRERVVDLRLDQANAGVDHESEYSAMTSTGEFVLVRDIVHVARHPSGDIDSLMGFIVAVRPGKAQLQPQPIVPPRY